MMCSWLQRICRKCLEVFLFLKVFLIRRNDTIPYNHLESVWKVCSLRNCKVHYRLVMKHSNIHYTRFIVIWKSKVSSSKLSALSIQPRLSSKFIHQLIMNSVWRSSQAEIPTDHLQNFYSSLHTWLISLSDEIITLFGDRDDSTFACE